MLSRKYNFFGANLVGQLNQNIYSMVEMIGSPDVLASENMEPGCKTSLGTPARLSPRPATGTILGAIDTNVCKQRRYNSSRKIEIESNKLSQRLGGGKLVIVEGNIGVGKTTLTQKLANDLKYKVFLEPSTDNPFLGMFELKLCVV